MLYFFFQAEDGIRDSSVTGVQTCALPISVEGYPMIDNDEQLEQTRRAIVDLEAAVSDLKKEVLPLNRSRFALMAEPVVRSEERRVGKECRSRWSPYH